LASAKWAIGGQGIGLQDGIVRPYNTRVPNARTAVAIDRDRDLLFLSVAENISPRRILQRLADLGAKDGMLLDGGGSSSMALGKQSAGSGSLALFGGWRPVATQFGVRARHRSP
jgi:hypothetical protein